MAPGARVMVGVDAGWAPGVGCVVMFSAWRLVSVKVSSGCVGRRQASVPILRNLSAVPLCDMPLNRPSLASSWTASWAGVHAAGDLCAALASGAAEGLGDVEDARPLELVGAEHLE